MGLFQFSDIAFDEIVLELVQKRRYETRNDPEKIYLIKYYDRTSLFRGVDINNKLIFATSVYDLWLKLINYMFEKTGEYHIYSKQAMHDLVLDTGIGYKNLTFEILVELIMTDFGKNLLLRYEEVERIDII
jgi:hypothetical protein